MWTDLDLRIEECRVKQLVAEMHLKILQFQAELELFNLKVQAWVVTHSNTGEERNL